MKWRYMRNRPDFPSKRKRNARFFRVSFSARLRPASNTRPRTSGVWHSLFLLLVCCHVLVFVEAALGAEIQCRYIRDWKSERDAGIGSDGDGIVFIGKMNSYVPFGFLPGFIDWGALETQPQLKGRENAVFDTGYFSATVLFSIVNAESLVGKTIHVLRESMCDCSVERKFPSRDEFRKALGMAGAQSPEDRKQGNDEWRTVFFLLPRTAKIDHSSGTNRAERNRIRSFGVNYEYIATSSCSTMGFKKGSVEAAIIKNLTGYDWDAE
jgi:hypothetical protein